MPDSLSSFRPIETFYHGILYRSRLEARWAVFLRELGITTEYEKEGFHLHDGGLYLPDFWLPQVRMWGEVKPNDRRDRLVVDPVALRKGVAVAMGTRHPLVFFDGPPRDTNYWAIWPDEMDPVGWDWIDVVPAEGNAYHLSEGRFYASSGGNECEHDWLVHNVSEGDLHPAAVAANSARFDRGRA